MCLSGHYKAPFPFDKQTAGFNSPYNQLMTVAMDYASLCGSYVKVTMAPIDTIWLSLVLNSLSPEKVEHTLSAIS